ncbi:SdrD B-like domain-containing protein [Actinotignum sp. GS-2025b]|uniref:SdrD B-like domain-containing protein n=1 Tax=Actinotignum sp. GS-2025b TaxID=3427275 RepID=UPI003F48BA8B
MQKLKTGAARSRVAAHRLITGAVAALIAAFVAVGGAIPLTAPAMAANVRVTTNGDNAANTTGETTNATGENTENSENAERAAEAASARLEVAVAEPADQKTNGVKSGALASYDVQWSCAGVQGQCENTTLSVTIPGLVDSISDTDQLPLTHVSATNSSHDQSAVPVREGDTYTWNLGTVPVGTTGAMRVQVRPENLRWPEGEAIHPKVAGETNGLVADPVELATPVHATPTIAVRKFAPESQPAIGGQYTYTITAGYEGAFNTNENKFQDPGTGTPGLMGLTEIRLVDTLPEGAEFVRATNGGTYDPATRAVTWVVPGSPVVRAIADYRVTVAFPAGTFAEGASATNNVQATGTPLDPKHAAVTATDSVTRQLQNLRAEGNFRKTANKAVTQRDGEASWDISWSNTGNVPLRVHVADNLPCRYVSPETPGACATPALRNVKAGLVRPLRKNVPATVTYTTTSGKQLSVVVDPTTTRDFPLTVPAGEEITSIALDVDVVNGERSDITLEIRGTVVADFPADVHNGTTAPDGATYSYAPRYEVPTLENRAVVTAQSLDFEGNPTPDLPAKITTRESAAQVAIVDGYPTYGVSKTSHLGGQMVGNLDTKPGELFQTGQTYTFGLGFYTGKGAKLYPVIMDLLAPGMEYDPTQQITTSANWPATLPLDKMRVETEMKTVDGKQRQLVRFTWPEDGTGDYFAPPSTGDQSRSNSSEMVLYFGAKITAATEPGENTNDMILADAKRPNLGTAVAPNQCIRNWWARTDSRKLTDNLDGLNRPEARGCTTSTKFNVAGLPALAGKNYVKGDVDTEFQANPNYGTVSPASNAELKLDLVNNGNAGVSGVVAYDVLPYPGDHGVSGANTPENERGSTWRPRLNGPLTFGEGTPQPTSVLYSTSINPCRGEVMELGAAQDSSPQNCEPGTWKTAEELGGDFSQVRAFRVEFPQDAKLTRADTWTINANVTAPAAARGIAWNSYAVTGKNAETGAPVMPTEPAKVGLTMPFDLDLTKENIHAKSADLGVLSEKVTADPAHAGLAEGVQLADIEKQNETERWATGSVVEYVVRAKNAGPGFATGVEITDMLPKGVTYVGYWSTNGGYDAATGTWSINDTVTEVVDPHTGDPVEGADPSATDDAYLRFTHERGIAPGGEEVLHLYAVVDETARSQQVCNEALTPAKDRLDSKGQKFAGKQANACLTVGVNLGDRIFEDTNNNGADDPGEPGLAGVTVKVFRPGDTEPFITTTTDASGKYLVRGLEPGTYSVVVDRATLPKREGTWETTHVREGSGDKEKASSGQITLSTADVLDADFGFHYVAPVPPVPPQPPVPPEPPVPPAPEPTTPEPTTPAPAPSPTTTAPAPQPTTDRAQPDPEPTPSATTTEPAPPAPQPTTPEPVPTTTAPAPGPQPTTPEPSAPEPTVPAPSSSEPSAPEVTTPVPSTPVPTASTTAPAPQGSPSTDGPAASSTPSANPTPPAQAGSGPRLPHTGAGVLGAAGAVLALLAGGVLVLRRRVE